MRIWLIDLEYLYFEWLLTRLDPGGVREGVAYLCSLLHKCSFKRRVGNDVNRALEGVELRRHFLTQMEDADFDPRVTNALLEAECTWLEMLVALAIDLDFLYDGGVEIQFVELIHNMGLDPILGVGGPARSEMMEDYDQHLVDVATSIVDDNDIDENGKGGLFPLNKNDHPDQRTVEIWDQHAAYFREKLEGVYF
jgi:hypothetical protein